MDLVLWTVAALLFLQLVFVLWNLGQLPRLGGTGEGQRWLAGKGGERTDGSGRPKCSILIPARNEAANIAACLQSVLADPSSSIEVLVLDDRSTDGTGEIARNRFGADKRLNVMEGRELPPGWLGKSYACHQLAGTAQGDWWLFLDADARLAAGALSAAMDTALEQGRGLVTGFPRQQTSTWLERLIVPMMSFTIACHLPVRLVRNSRDPRFVAAHGAFMLIQAESYRACGGHASFRNHLVDDMQLARSVKLAGLPVTLADVTPQISMRMYHDAREVWNGYKKNIYAGIGRNAFLLFMLLAFYAALYLLPPAALLVSLLSLLAGHPAAAAGWLVPAAVGWGLATAIKYAIDRRGGQPVWLALVLPASIVMLAAIALASWKASASGSGYLWKGRHYS